MPTFQRQSAPGSERCPRRGALRTLNDCAREALSPEILRQAAQQALRRGLVRKNELREVEKTLNRRGRLHAPPIPSPTDASQQKVTNGHFSC